MLHKKKTPKIVNPSSIMAPPVYEEEEEIEDEHPTLRRWLTVPLVSKAKISRRGSFGGRLVVETIKLNVRQENDDGIDKYTSLCDLLQDDESSARLQSPTSCYDIPIRNMLVKQAAYAYLQPQKSPKPQKEQSWFGRIFLQVDEDGSSSTERHSSDRSSDGCKGFVCYIFRMFVVVLKRVID